MEVTIGIIERVFSLRLSSTNDTDMVRYHGNIFQLNLQL